MSSQKTIVIGHERGNVYKDEAVLWTFLVN